VRKKERKIMKESTKEIEKVKERTGVRKNRL
jgi:hypothetical protein